MFEEEKELTLDEYMEEKIILIRDFGIYLTDEQTAHIKSLKSEIAVDNFARDILKPGYGSSNNDTGKRIPFSNHRHTMF